MKSIAAFVTVALTLASSSLAAPALKRKGPGKRGLCWPFYNSPLDPGKLNDGQGTVNLIYDYETFLPPSSNGNGGLNFIGMQRCLDCDSSPISQLAARQQQNGFSTLFTLNEPDINGITPQQAADWYKQNINPLPIKKALPAVTASQNPGQGLDWLQQMLDACAGQCFFDYINLVSSHFGVFSRMLSAEPPPQHHYGASFDQFKAHVEDANTRFGKPIVITEFALQAPATQADQCVFPSLSFSTHETNSTVFSGSHTTNKPLPSSTPLPSSRCTSPFVATSPSLFTKNDANGANFVGTGSTLYNDDGSISAVGQLMLQ
ncbi:Glyco-hydro-cc domain-containing protein [Mycena venus]|uniref:Glyco-hydro-cc domain-containing protein n=1 Tax=Mycena venus TaxID=2733690 RepID=A0A8H6Y914_9AGAR|nr:Glyco-hydro-cc domain-containing protein [Mycena venus]